MMTREQFELTKTMLEQASSSFGNAAEHWKNLDRSRKVLAGSFFDYAERFSCEAAQQFASRIRQ